MNLESILTILAIVIGPLIAVQVTRLLDNRKEHRNRRLAVYRTLMSTRGSPLSYPHVEALNSIDLEFHGNGQADTQVRLAWKAYLSHLGDSKMEPNQWDVRRVDLLIDLLKSMGDSLKYRFDKTHIKDGIYNPDRHGRLDNEQDFIRQAIAELLSGRRALPVALRSDVENALQSKNENSLL